MSPNTSIHCAFVVLATAALLTACAGPRPAPSCEAGTLPASSCPPAGAVQDEWIDELYEVRAWYTQKEQRQLDFDPVRFGSEADIPIQGATGKFLGSTAEDARRSLAAKLWMIENAQHTVDLVYYIFRNDLVGYALLGALCEAVQRGVDVRVIVDSAGSISTPKPSLIALEICEENAGFMRNADGAVTTRRARVQIVVFNALTRLSSSPNRRSHDKLLVKDGAFPDQAYIMTGGRNVALDYYGIDADGQLDPHAYQDAEILLRPRPGEDTGNLGRTASDYFSLLFLYRGNRLMTAAQTDRARDWYYREQAQSLDSLEMLRTLPILQQPLEAMDA